MSQGEYLKQAQVLFGNINIKIMKKSKSILQEAHDIVFERAAEKTRQYGEFIAGMEQTARIASEMSRKEITTVDAYNILIALKLSRASWNYKQDNYLDALAYMASLDQYLSQKQK
jgi:RNase H-fold protein (predicted Holliday junction resolvase)